MLKRKFGLYLNKNKRLKTIWSFLVNVNLILFHWKERERKISNGNEAPETTYYVIRPRGTTEGLLSTYFYVLESCFYAYQKNYVPIVDFASVNCQYYTGRDINGTKNAWEYYFRQPNMINESYINGKKNIILSGWKLGKDNKIQFSQDKVNQFQEIIEKIDIQDYIKKMVNEVWRSQFEGKKVLGVFLRGTDYVALKPKGHNVQPTLAQMISKIDEFLEKYNNEKLFIVTEDYSYFKQLKEKYGNKVFSYSNQFIQNYNGKDYIEKDFSDDSYQRGLQYLIRILLLSRCEYQICSIASGSSFSRLFRLESPRDEYWFDLGLYE